jgi:hypothetical protein
MFKAAFVECAVLGVVFSFAAVAAQAQSVPRPDWKVGDTWTVAITVNSGIGGTSRHEEVRVVKEAGENGYLVESTPKPSGTPSATAQMLQFSRDLNFINPTASNGAPQEYKWLQWPLEVGRSYQFESTFQNHPLDWKGRVVGWQDVEVPAGKFKALRLEFERSGSNRNAASESVWYAPDAKLVVKRIQARPGVQRSRDITTTELMSYKFN